MSDALAWEQPSPWSSALWCAAVTFSIDLNMLINMHLAYINERGVNVTPRQ